MQQKKFFENVPKIQGETISKWPDAFLVRDSALLLPLLKTAEFIYV